LGYNRPALDATAGFSSPHRRVPRTGAPVFALGLALGAACLTLGLAACAGAPGGRVLDRGDRALEAGEPDKAEALFRSAAEVPEAAPATVAAAKAGLGVALARQGRWDEAAEALEAAAAEGPDTAAVLFDLGVAYRHLGRYDDARAAYEKALKAAPGDLETAYNLGILYELYLNQPGPALAAYRRYVAGGGPEAARVSRWIEALEAKVAKEAGQPQGGNLP
jgi:tetratricopeptide (TPR) repeat protein